MELVWVGYGTHRRYIFPYFTSASDNKFIFKQNQGINFVLWIDQSKTRIQICRYSSTSQNQGLIFFDMDWPTRIKVSSLLNDKTQWHHTFFELCEYVLGNGDEERKLVWFQTLSKLLIYNQLVFFHLSMGWKRKEKIK